MREVLSMMPAVKASHNRYCTTERQVIASGEALDQDVFGLAELPLLYKILLSLLMK